jgi:CheY-like chemotaxis protein
MAKIVIAEDEQDIRELIAFTLKYAGHEVVTCGDGLEAVELTRIERPELVLLDVRMPKMTGYEACLLIKEDPDLKHIPVVFLSAKGQESEIEQGISSGATAYLLKPFAPDQLVLELNKIIETQSTSQNIKLSEIDDEEPIEEITAESEEQEE